MYQTILTRQDVNEGTEVHNALNAALVDCAHFDLGSDFLDPVYSSLSGGGISGVDFHVAVVIQVDGRTGLVADTTDGSTTLTDNITDLVRMDLDGGDARSALRQLGAGLGDNLVHLVQDVQTRSVGLLQGDFHDFVGNTLDFDIHLQGSYAVFGTGNLEVHVAQVIFVTQDVCQNRELVAFLDQTHGDTGNRRLQGHTCVHKSQGRTTHGSHGAGTVGFSDLGHRTDGVREFFDGRHNRGHATLGQTTVTDFTTARRAHTARFTYGVRREVVVEQERIFTLAFQGIDGLHVTGGTQSGRYDGLGFTTGEQGRTVNGRQYANFNLDGANSLVVTTIDTRLAFDNLQTNHRLLNLAEVFLHFLCGRLAFFFTGQFLNGSGFDLTQTVIASHLVTDCVGFFDGTTELGFDGIQKLGVLCLRLPFPARLAVFSSKFLDGGDSRLHFFVGKQYRTQHLVFSQALGLGLNHQYRFIGTSHYHVQQRAAQLFEGRVQEVAFLVGVTHTGSTNRTVERDPGDGQGGRGSDH